jgi:hypothetical protein
MIPIQMKHAACSGIQTIIPVQARRRWEHPLLSRSLPKMITEGIVIDATFKSVVATLENIVEASTTYEPRVTTKLVLAQKSAARGMCP